MPQDNSWSPLLREWIEKENDCFGVYYLGGEDGAILYIGKGHVLTSLRSHLEERPNYLKGTTRYSVEYAGNLNQAAKHFEQAIKKYVENHGQPPKYNLDDGAPIREK